MNISEILTLLAFATTLITVVLAVSALMSVRRHQAARKTQYTVSSPPNTAARPILYRSIIHCVAY